MSYVLEAREIVRSYGTVDTVRGRCFVTSEGLSFAHLAAVSVVVSLPVVIAGWVVQDKLIRGLSLGAVK